MNTVIIICDDPRIKLVKEALQSLLTTRVCVVTNFDAGVNAVFEKQPLVVFIQDEIAKINGDTLKYHVKSLFQENSPQFITLDHADYCSGLVRNFSDGINLNLPVEELVAVFRQHLMKISGILWMEQIPPPTASGSQLYINQADDQPIIPVIDPPAMKKDDVPTSGQESLIFPVIEITSPDIPSPATAESSSLDTTPAHLPMTVSLFQQKAFPARPSVRQWSRLSHVLMVTALMLLACGVIFVIFPSNTGQRLVDVVRRSSSSDHPLASAVTAKPSTDRNPGVWTVPSFILLEWLDPTYGAARSGWERYCSSRLEFFIFRHEGEIKVVQIVALEKGALTRSFISAALRELYGATITGTGSRSVRDGYLIEQKKSSTRTQVLFYKNRRTGETLGVIILLS